jgi:hypothetical protein
MKTLKQYKDEQIKDAAFAKEYEAIQPEMDVIRAIVEARTSQNIIIRDPYFQFNTSCKRKSILWQAILNL